MNFYTLTYLNIFKELVDFPSLKLEEDSFIDNNLNESFSDVLFSAKINQQEGYLYLLCEHQSTTDRLMAFRLFKYMLQICDQHLTKNPESKTLPLVYPLGFYNSERKYNVSRNLWGLFDCSKLAKEVWTNDYQLVNVHNIADSELKKKAWSGILQFFLKYIHSKDLLKKWYEIKDILPDLLKVTIGYDYIEMILQYTLTNIKQEDIVKLQEMFNTVLNKQIGEKLMGTAAQHWEARGEARSIQIGEKRTAIAVEKRNIEIAISLKKANTPIDVISKATGLNEDFIRSL